MAIFQTYTIGRGDNLSAVSKAFNVQVDDLIAINGIKNRNRIFPGQVIRIRKVSETYHLATKGDDPAALAKRQGVPLGAIEAANGLKPGKELGEGQRVIIPTTTAPQTASSISPVRELGNLSRKYEVSGRGPETVSTGKGDAGGASYGTYQLASKLGRPAEFLATEGSRWAPRFGNLVQGSPEFTAAWKQVAKKEPQTFQAAQHAFIERTHYAVQLAWIRQQTTADLSTHSRAIQDVIWSTAVQHGPRGSIIVNAIKSVGVIPSGEDFDRALIDAIYSERGRRDPDGRLAHFRKNSVEVQEGVAKRFRNERNDAIAMLDAERTKQVIAAAVTEHWPGSNNLLRRVAAKMSDEEAYRLMEKYGDDEARSDWMAGRKVCVVLRRPTNWKKFEMGRYDDPMLLIWREGNSVKVGRFWCTTEPAGAYAFGHERAARGPTADLDRDGRTDLGRLCPGVYHFHPESHPHLGSIYRARDIQIVERDVNQDGQFSARDPASGDRIDPTGAGRTMYIHKGGTNFTGSAGCQTLAPAGFAKFLSRLAGQASLSYLLINAE